MKKLKKILQLSDPYPNFGYEISCYLKATLGFVLLIFGLFLTLSPWLKEEPVIFGLAIILGPLGEKILLIEKSLFGQNFVPLSLAIGPISLGAGFWLLWQIKLIRKLVKEIKKSH